MLFILSLTVGVIAYFSSTPFNARFNESLKNVRAIYSPPSFKEKVESDAIYMASQNDSLSKEHFMEEILKNKEWIELIKSKEPQYETSIGKRYIYFKHAISIFKQKPIFGFGSHQFKKLYIKNYPDFDPINHPHNNFLFILCELGLIGLLLLLKIFYHQIISFFSDPESDFLKLIFPLFFLFIMFFDNYFINHNTLTFFCLFSFIIYNTSYKKF